MQYKGHPKSFFTLCLFSLLPPVCSRRSAEDASTSLVPRLKNRGSFLLSVIKTAFALQLPGRLVQRDLCNYSRRCRLLAAWEQSNFLCILPVKSRIISSCRIIQIVMVMWRQCRITVAIVLTASKFYIFTLENIFNKENRNKL